MHTEGSGGGEAACWMWSSRLSTGEYADWFTIRGEGHRRIEALLRTVYAGRWCRAAPLRLRTHDAEHAPYSGDENGDS